MDPSLQESDDGWKAAAVMLAALTVGHNQRKLREATGVDTSLVAKFSYNLKKAGVWKGRKTFANWADPENGAVSFWCDVNVALGFLQRA